MKKYKEFQSIHVATLESYLRSGGHVEDYLKYIDKLMIATCKGNSDKVSMFEKLITHITQNYMGKNKIILEKEYCDYCASQDTWQNSSGELQCDNCGYSETE